MTIEAPATSFPHLYDGSVKIILIGARFPARKGAAGRLRVRTLRAARNTRTGALHIMEEEPARMVAESALQRLRAPPTNVWFVWAGDDAALKDAEALLAWWREVGGPCGVPTLGVGPVAELERRLLERALHEVPDLHRRNQDLQRSLSALREEWAHATRIPPEVIELLENLRLSPPRMLFGSVPSAGELHLPALTERMCGAPPGTVLVQRLPAWARGLVGIDLHVAQPGGGAGALLASLHALDTGRVLANWWVPFADLCPGWLPLRLPAASSQPDRVLELRVCCVALDAAPPSLSLAPVGLLEEFSLRVDPDPTPASVLSERDLRMLALRLWGGLPGIAHDAAANQSVRPLPPSVTFALPDHLIAQVRRTREGSAPFPWFGYLGAGKILLHPLRGRVVGACIPLQSMPALASVACETMIEDVRCQSSIACKLVVAPPGIAVDRVEREESVLGSSGRVTIEAPLRPHLLAARLREPCHEPVHLHLFSEIPDGGPGHYGRAVFTRFRVEIDRHAAWSMPPALAGAREGAG